MERLYLSIFIGRPLDPAGGDRVLVRGQSRILLEPVHPHLNPTLNKMKTMDGLLVSNYDKSVIKLMPKGTDPTAPGLLRTFPLSDRTDHYVLCVYI